MLSTRDCTAQLQLVVQQGLVTAWKLAVGLGTTDILPTSWLDPPPGSRALSALLPHTFHCFAFPLVQVTFKNLASRPFSFHSTLTAYEGTTQQGGVVQPGGHQKYSWKVLHQMAPTTQEFDCKAWAYFSNVDLVGGSLHGASKRAACLCLAVRARNFLWGCAESSLGLCRFSGV